MRSLAALLALSLLVPALAGCASEAPATTSEPIKKGNASPAPTSGGGKAVEPVKPKGTSERWHFHDHWNGNPTITLLEQNVTLNLTLTDEGSAAYGAVLELPRGTVVPPETGFLTITVNWSTPEPGPLNLTYRPADSMTFLPFADVRKGEPVELKTTESMADVPHRQESWWRFNLSAPAALDPANPGAGVQAPPTSLQVTINATIGRPLFIDPPHLDWWLGGETLRLVTDATGEFSALNTPAGRNITLPGAPQPGPKAVVDNVTVRMDEGRIVPEGAKSVVVLLNWTGDVPDAKLTLRYAEGNYPSAGALELAQDGANSRIFVLPVTNGMTDTTYSNRTTWQFHVAPEGDAGAFRGSFVLNAWVTKLAPAEAVIRTLGG